MVVVSGRGGRWPVAGGWEPGRSDKDGKNVPGMYSMICPRLELLEGPMLFVDVEERANCQNCVTIQ